MMNDGQAHLDVVGHGGYAGHALDIFLDGAPLSKTANESGQCHDAIFDRDTNIGCDNVRIRYQLVLYVSFDIQV